MNRKKVKPQILICGELKYAPDKWPELHEQAELLEFTPKCRSEFIQDLTAGKYKNIVGMFRSRFNHNITGNFDAELISQFPDSLKFIAQFGAGYDEIDVDELNKRKIQLSNTSIAVDVGTADTALYLILGTIRNFPQATYGIHNQEWKTRVPLGHDPSGLVLGIIGMGGIGRAVRDRCSWLNFKKIIYYNRKRLPSEQEKDTEYKSSLDDLYAEADVISLHLPLNDDSYHLINADSIAKMKDGVIIINTARGKIIREADLIAGLESGKISSVGLDVFENKPKVSKDLLNNPNALLLPHMGTSTHETRAEMERMVIRNILAGIATGKLIDLVPEQRFIF